MSDWTKDKRVANEVAALVLGCISASLFGLAWWMNDAGVVNCVGTRIFFVPLIFAICFAIAVVGLLYYRLRSDRDDEPGERVRISPGVRWRTVVALMLLAAVVGNRGTRLIPAAVRGAVARAMK